MALWNYRCLVSYSDPTTGDVKELDLRLNDVAQLSDAELETVMHDYAATVIGDYKFRQLGLTDPSVFVGSITVCSEEEEL